MIFLSNLQTRYKLGICFGLLLLAFSVASTLTYVSIERINSASVANHRSLILAAQSERLLTLILEQLNGLRGYVIKGEPEFVRTYETAKQQFDEELTSFATTTTISGQKDAAARMKAAMADWRATLGDKVILLMQDPTKRAEAAGLTGTKSLTTLRAIQKEILNTAHERVALREAEQQAATGQAATALVSGSVAAAVLAILLAFVLSRSVAAPMMRIAGAMAKLAAGDQTIVVPSSERRDEVGSMAMALLTFKQAAIEKSRIEADAQAQRQMSDAERRRNEAQQAGSAAAQAEVVAALARGLDMLSSGDLTSQLNDAFSTEYEKLRVDFNAAVGKLRATIQVIANTSGEIRSGAAEVSHASGDLSRRTEAQAASLEQTAAALDEITATVRRTADGASAARDIVGAAKVDAERSGEVVRQAVEAMGGIEQSSRKISQIIGVIDEIAFQTNLLALNAGVEAARAGDAGRGFAVVASEVRELAHRSAQAAKEIKALISASVGQVDHGVRLVKQTGVVLERVVGQVTEITAIVSEIAASAREQATGLDQVNTAVNQMDLVTQQNAAMVEQATAASQGLATQADELKQLVSQFKIEAANPSSRRDIRHARAA